MMRDINIMDAAKATASSAMLVLFSKLATNMLQDDPNFGSIGCVFILVSSFLMVISTGALILALITKGQ